MIAEAKSTKKTNLKTEKPRILVVDDENGPRQALRMLLNENYDVELAANVDSAFRVLDSGPVDLVITDISMPKRSGVDLLREVKKQNPDLQVILFTGYGQLETATKAVEYGAFAYMEKPFDNSEMLRVVQAALDKSASEKQRRELERVAMESNRFETLGRLVSGLMHDMGTPLSVLNMQIEVAQGDDDAEVLKDRLRSMQEQVQHCLEIVRATMDYLRYQPDDQSTWRLNSVVTQSAEIAASLCREHDVNLVQDLGENIHMLSGDMMLMRQAVLNLITNAVQAMHGQTDGKQIQIETRQDGQTVYLTVADTGPGIPENDHRKIFRTFYTTKGNSGTGLGLTVVKTILEKMNATIEVSNASPRGARFTIAIPISS